MSDPSMWEDRVFYPAGALYYTNDQQLRLPGAVRIYHVERRPVLVVSDQNNVHGTNALPANEWPSVLVVPISHSTSYVTRFCVKIASGDGNLPRRGWARVPALQVIDKSALGEWIGQVRRETLDAVTRQILNYFGLIEPTPLMPPDDDQLDDIPL